jgi:hypothetical protein
MTQVTLPYHLTKTYLSPSVSSAQAEKSCAGANHRGQEVQFDEENLKHLANSTSSHPIASYQSLSEGIFPGQM